MYGDGILYSGPTVFSNELVTNGNFQTDTDWVEDGGAAAWSISGGKANCVANASTRYFNQTNALPAAGALKLYRVIYTISNYVQGAFRINVGGYQATPARLADGKYVEYLQVTNAASNKSIYLQANPNTIGSIDSVSVKEITQGSDFDFTRETTGTRINEDGYIEDVPYNLTTYSEDFSQWTLNGDSVVLQSRTYLGRPIYKLTEASASTLGIYNDSAGNMVGQTYTISLIAKKDTSSFIRLRYGSLNNKNVDFNLETGVVSAEASGVTGAIQNLGNGFYQISSTIASLINSTISYAIYTSNGSVLITSAQIVKDDKPKNYLPTTDRLNLPRLNYPTYGGCPSLLFEPQRTNLVEKSNDISNGGGNSLSNLQINSSNNLSPEGINNAQEIEVTSASQPKVESVAVSNATIYTTSVYVKKVTGDFFGLGYYQADIGNQYAKFNLDTGTFVAVESNGVVSQSATNIYNCEIIAHKNNWYRITCTILTGSDPVKSNIKWLAMSESAFNNGVVGDKFLIYGRQAEQASYATSLIHTVGSTVTRNEDIAADAGLGTTDTFNDSEGVFYAEIRSDNPEPTATYTSINDGTGGQNQVRIGYLIGSLYIQIRVGGGAFWLVNILEADVTQNNKVAVRYKAEDHAVFLNGFKLSTDTSNTIFAAGTLDRVNFSAYGTAGEFQGENKALAVYKTALTDTELANLTSYNNHDLFIPYRSRMQMIGANQELQCTEHDITRFL